MADKLERLLNILPPDKYQTTIQRFENSWCVTINKHGPIFFQPLARKQGDNLYDVARSAITEATEKSDGFEESFIDVIRGFLSESAGRVHVESKPEPAPAAPPKPKLVVKRRNKFLE